MHDLLQRLHSTLQTEIPLTSMLGLRVDSYHDGCLVLAAPLTPNINHKHTVFAGSLNAVLTLSGWGVLWLFLAEHGLHGQIVIQDSEIQYRHPVRTDFTARCCAPDNGQLQVFTRQLQRKRRARLELFAEAWDDARLCTTFHGRYVVQLLPGESAGD